MRVRQRRAEVESVDEGEQVATIRFADDAELREVSIPDAIQIAVGMTVKVVDVPGSTPIYAWGV
jgi:hypothetical protein